MNTDLNALRSLIDATRKNLEKLSYAVDKIDQEQRREVYKSMPGEEGYFDGENLIADSGKTIKVPQNYAAKSRLVFGDRLKLLKEGDKDIFKQISKVPRKTITGVLSKKEGKWYILSDSGSYRISDIAADFNKAELKDEAVGLIPEDNLNAPFAALDKLITTRAPIRESPAKKESVKVTKKPLKKEHLKKNEKKVVTPVVSKSPESKKEPTKTEKEFVNNILDDDDLR